ncbi:MAG: response regulator, partial [Deltaproteobacteria bacterium]|nr:response regulator [Deltaproteobacteria bacterium]
DELSEIFCGGNARAYLVVVSEEALGLAFVWNSLERRIKGAEGCSIAILRPSSLDMREKLYSLGMEYVLSAPVLADDLLLAYFGELPRRDLMSASKLTEIASINKKLKVIIADDVPTNRIILEDMFEERGDEVFSVGDGKDIVELVTPMLTGETDAAKFDLIITDITMSTMNGDEAARLVRQLESKHPNNPHVCMIAITGHAFKEEQEQIRGAGFDGVLAKPMTPEMLAKELSRLFSSS